MKTIITYLLFVKHFLFPAKEHRLSDREQSNMILQEIENRKIDREIEDQLKRMMHEYSHGEMVAIYPFGCAIMIYHEPTAKWLKNSPSEFLKQEFERRKKEYIERHGEPYDCFFRQSLTKPII